MGAAPEQFAQAAELMAESGFDVIDINFGCPVRKVDGDASFDDDICQICHLSTSNYNNSTALNKLKDRFPISIHLDASDIREVTYRRLLTKSDDGDKKLLR